MDDKKKIIEEVIEGEIPEEMINEFTGNKGEEDE